MHKPFIIFVGEGVKHFLIFLQRLLLPGSLSFASIEHVPHYLIDNASVLGALSIITALLFLIDLGAPRAKKARKAPKTQARATQIEVLPQYTQEVEKPVTKKEKKVVETVDVKKKKTKFDVQNGYKQMKDKPKRFDIYGKDGEDSESEVSTVGKHSPVWSNVRKGRVGTFLPVVKLRQNLN